MRGGDVNAFVPNDCLTVELDFVPRPHLKWRGSQPRLGIPRNRGIMRRSLGYGGSAILQELLIPYYAT